MKRWKNYHNKVVSIDKSRARPEVSPLVVLRVVDLGFFGGGLLWFAEEGVDDLELFWGEDFAGAGVAGGLEGGHEWICWSGFRWRGVCSHSPYLR